MAATGTYQIDPYLQIDRERFHRRQLSRYACQARDNDLKSANFFDVAKYPTMTFTSTKIWSTGNGTTKMRGNLTIHGVSKEVTFDVSGPTAPINAMGGMRRGVETTTKISRKDFGITADAGFVGDEISITIDAELLQRAAGQPH
jgi:polyisoprenoid-binding protein YceI